MKLIIFSGLDGRVFVMRPAEGARLAMAVNDDRRKEPAPVDTFLRGWPVPSATVEWAESEDEFVARIAAKDVPADAENVQIVDESEIPADRTNRAAWKLSGGKIVIGGRDG